MKGVSHARACARREKPEGGAASLRPPLLFISSAFGLAAPFWMILGGPIHIPMRSAGGVAASLRLSLQNRSPVFEIGR